MAKQKELPPLSEAQVEIMNIVWDHKSCSVADVWKILNQRRGVSRNTVHTLMVRLEEKKWLKRRVRGNSVTFSATASQKKTQQQSVRRLIDTVFDGSAEGLILALLNGRTVSNAESARIRELIAQAKKGRRS